MIDSPFFDLSELICPHVYEKYGAKAWNFLDVRAVITINTFRDRIGKPVFINNWQEHGSFSQRGLRCPMCQIVKDYIAKDILYMSAHTLGKGFDFEVQGLLAEEVRQWIIKNQNWWPYPIRLERGVNWVHLDMFGNDKGLKVIEFNK
jgi:hypothetical protein